VRTAPPSSLARLGPVLAFVLALSAFFLALLRDTNGATRIRLKGSTRVEAHAARSLGQLAISGSVVDDAGRPVSVRVRLGLTRRSGGEGELSLEDTLPESCAARAPASHMVLESATRLVFPTDSAGRFCVRLLLPRERFVAELTALGSELLDESRAELPVDAGSRAVALALTPSPGSIGQHGVPWPVNLDDDDAPVDVVATTDIDGLVTPLVALVITLTNESGAALGEATTATGGRAHFVVPTSRLGPAGRGELRATFVGSADLASSTCTMPIERRTHVRLSLPEARQGALPAVGAGETFGLRVVAAPNCAARGCKSTPTGIVEARVGEAVVGAATLGGGVARVVLAVDAAPPGGIPLSLRYISDAPWFLTADAVEAMQPVRAGLPWAKLATSVAGLGVFAWFVLARMAPATRRVATASPAAGTGRTVGVHLVEADPTGAGWTGRIVDAHEGHGVGGATIALERAGFDGTRVICRASSDDDGTFRLRVPAGEDEPESAQPSPARHDVTRGTSLVVASPLYSTLRRPTPSFGTVEIAIVRRKRELLDRLVAWAHRRGGAFGAKPEPTPAQVRDAAGSDHRVARWAEATERAAFGQDLVDDAAQRDVDRLAPDDAVDTRSGSPPTAVGGRREG
jgi:hypothetical protein